MNEDYKGFIEAPLSLLYDTRLNSNQKIIYLKMLHRSKFVDNYRPTNKELSYFLDCEPVTITRALRRLRECGYIETIYFNIEGNKNIDYREIIFNKENLND